MKKKLQAFLASALLVVLSLLPALPARADTNLVANPSFETANGTAPAGWSKDKWGTNTTAYTYETTGHTGSHSASVTLSNYKTGDAKWYFAPVAVTPGVTYSFSDWYKSTTMSSIDAVVTTTTGKTSYIWKTDLAASSAWKQASFAFKAPSNAKNVTFFHYIMSNGTLTTDDYSFSGPGTTPAPTAPAVSLTAPTANATVSGTQAVSASASDAQGITSVQFKLDGNNLGAADTTAPYSVSWDTTAATNGSHTLTAVATNVASLSTTATNVTVNVNNTVTPVPTAPTVAFTAPAANSSVSGSTTVSANAGGTQAITSVQFKVDGNVAATLTTAPYSFAWDTTKVANGSHTLSVTATNSANLTSTATENVSVNNPTAPVVNITAPANSTTVSGAQAVTATATSNVAITSVQFKLDGADLGAPVTAAPYTLSWDTTKVANGNHTLNAVATNSAGQTTTSANVTVNVSNTVVTPPAPTGQNLILNPSVEVSTSGQPTNWHGDGWGTNTHTTTYENTGHTGSHSVKTTVSAFTNGAAEWYFDDVAVTTGKTYQYSNWYESTIDTEIDAQVTNTDGSVHYYYLGMATASPSTWAKFSAQFTVPAGAKSMSVYQLITKVGSVTGDDFSLVEYTPSGFNRAIVSLTFDDGWRSQYSNALPILDKYGVDATFYLLTSTTDYPDYMTVAMMQTLKDHGNELDSHTVTHPHLPTLTVSQIDQELADSQTQLRAWFGSSVADDFATPYGEYNGTVLTEIKKYYRSHRSTDEGFNSKDNFDVYNIKVQNILYTTTAAQVQSWVQQAQRDHTWLVLVYHEVATAVEDPTYSISPTDLDVQISAMKSNGIAIETVGQALNEILPQL